MCARARAHILLFSQLGSRGDRQRPPKQSPLFPCSQRRQISKQHRARAPLALQNSKGTTLTSAATAEKSSPSCVCVCARASVQRKGLLAQLALRSEQSDKHGLEPGGRPYAHKPKGGYIYIYIYIYVAVMMSIVVSWTTRGIRASMLKSALA